MLGTSAGSLSSDHSQNSSDVNLAFVLVPVQELVRLPVAPLSQHPDDVAGFALLVNSYTDRMEATMTDWYRSILAQVWWPCTLCERGKLHILKLSWMVQAAANGNSAKGQLGKAVKWLIHICIPVSISYPTAIAYLPLAPRPSPASYGIDHWVIQ